jgi:hypothetical protein
MHATFLQVRALSARRRVASLVLVSLGTVLLFCGTSAWAYQVYGKIGEKYAALGGPAGPLGQPTSDEADAPHGGRFNSFQHGFIYWHPQIGTAYAVWGAIATRWNEAGRVQYGYPITDELATPDGRGRFNHFRAMHIPQHPEASIYWTPQTGAHLVYGEIRKAWAAAGWERSIGYPTSDEFQWGNYRRSNFEAGYVAWSANGGARVVRSGDAILRESPPNTFGSILVTGFELAIDDRPFAGNSTILSENTLCMEYERRRHEIAELLKNTIRAQANPRMRGFGIRSDARMNPSTSCSLRAEVSTAGSNTIRLRTYLPANSFNFHVTTPSVFGSWADPEFSIMADVSAETLITIPATPSESLNVGPTRVFVSNPRLDSHNVTGDIALAINEVHKFFVGGDLASQLTQNRVFEYRALQQGLGDLSPQVRQIPGTHRIETTIVPGNLLRINGTGRPAPSPPVIR